MKRLLILLIALSAFAAPSTTNAQAPEPAKARVPLEIEVVITRYDGTKKVSSLPYTLAVNANGSEVQLNMGADVAIPSTAFTPVAGGGSNVNPLTSYTYRSVGTGIVARATTAEDGRYDLMLNIDDSSVYTNPAAPSGVGQLPAFRSFRSRNTLLLRDGQTREYTAATDRVSGEVVKVSVTLKIAK
jgi:hypothetical protein